MENKQNLDGSTPKELGQSFWNDQYIANTTGWDLGQVSPPLKAYIDQLTNKDIKILIPGCGNSYEAEYLLKMGFTNVSLIDIAPDLVERLKAKFKSEPHIKIILGDFFSQEGEYDLILEQTFFCALDPGLRKSYVEQMKNLLKKGGKLAGVLFVKEFEQAGPPFGGSKEEYKLLFENDFDLQVFESCYNSFAKRAGTEMFVVLQKK
ncbi:Thiopurine S-methyltransferase (TPMT) [Daejeonella rubra]|uniref:Thiopurine S-methyltransferase (TPMT) n=1 Tax=Daejeonella rubra TaxID=990371 RepID=A0A1G9V834_9SPHI|nr:methyltransferase domain-containing protein [Daejeonella rubra]SDM68378.1 Thiopurine S-methyltransferase (TPMT) [Daejeonella rubra]